VLAKAPSPEAVGENTVRSAAELSEALQSSLWLRDSNGDYRCLAQVGYPGTPEQSLVRTRVTAESGDALIAGRKVPFVADANEIAQLYGIPQRGKGRDCAVAPLHGIEGWIDVRSPLGDNAHFTERRLRLLAGISYQTSNAMQKAELYKKQKESADVANALLTFGRDLAAAEGMDEVLNWIVERSALILGAPSAVLWLQDPDTRELKATATHGFEGEQLERLLAMRFSEETTRPFADAREPFVIRADEAAAIEGADFFDAELVAVAPVKLDSGRLAFLVISAPALRNYEFSARKMRLLSGIAHQAALAINSCLSFASLEQTFLDTVEALANALEARDEYTSSHARWITDTALEVGNLLDLDVATLKRLELGALFHDIGKIGISNDILMKPGPLTEDEWEVMKTHPELGEMILAPIERLSEVRPVVRACHEHYDGGGYPDGRTGENIPIEARIVLVVDAFHAMTTDRPYRAGLPREEAVRRLREGAGSQFDPQVVDVFLRLVEGSQRLALSV
jgi:HD-GYP domain-containing protein (c-di-GMP phosphodiesterase class II)